MPTGTSFFALYPTVRSILGDRLVHGSWNYKQVDLNDAIRAAYLLGKFPVGFKLDTEDPSQSSMVVPALTAGDPYALVVYETALICVGGEDGAGMIRTRAIWSQDKGDRKRALMETFRHEIYKIRDGDSVFATYQNLMQFLGVFQKDEDGMQSISSYIELDVVSRIPSIAI